MIMKNTNSIRHFARSGDDSEIEIFTDVIKEITSGTYKSYTMYIKTSDTIASKFYNLTLEEKEGNTAAFITKYSPTENWLNDKNQPFDGGITTFRVEPGPGGSIKFTQFDEGGGGTSYPPYCDGVVVATTVFTEVLCGCGHTWQDYLMNLCTGCTTGYPSFPSFAQSTLYECISTPGSGYSPAGGSSPGSSQPGEPSNSSLTTIVGVPDMPRVSYLTEPLSLDARQNDYLIDNPAIEDQLGSYIDQNTINDVIDPAAMAFAIDLIDYVRTNFTNQNDALDYIISEIIVEKINDSALDECTKGILNKLKNLQQNDIAKIMRRFDAPNSVFNVNFSQVPNLVNPSSQQNVYGLFEPTQHSLNYNIKLNANYFKNDGATNLGKASTILHEFIHALIASVIQNPNTPNNTDSTNFPAVWNAYVNLERGSTTPEDHTFMGNHYVNIIGAALQEYDTGVPVPDGQSPQQLYTDLAWAGIWAPDSSYNQFNGVLTGADKARIYNRKNTEMDRSNAFGMTPSSNNPCL